MRIILLLSLVLLSFPAVAQKVISDYDQATTISPSDKLLMQQGPRTTPYTYGTTGQLLGSVPPSLPTVPGNTFFLDNAPPHPIVVRLGDRATLGYTNLDPLVQAPFYSQMSWAGDPAIFMGWLERDAAMSVYTTHGSVAFAAASRASDYVNGAAPKAAYAVTGFGLADAANSDGEGAYFEARTTNVTGTGVAIEAQSGNYAGPTPTTNPYNAPNRGSAIGLLLGAGGDPGTPGSIWPSAAGIIIGRNHSTWANGLVFLADSLNGDDGVTSFQTAKAITFGKGHEVGWTWDSSGTRSGFIRSDSKAPGMGIEWDEAGNLRILSAAEAVMVSFDIFGGISPTGFITVPAGKAVIHTPQTVASLQSCSSGISGSIASVTDAVAPTYNGTLTGGGSVHIPVFCNGTAWVAH